ncbi:DUF4181 domain-containing protein [Alkalihalophilus marmarensis]|uniref:DUF4181 domain-containing protein n=1 Tax=Alkalihalophilus marmarensis DSM 21297 TaxID=1188261 RepID=U6SQJ0_9BACI|nr:DUF4181 domain-containing protein [Alkalihalophilus marmarensis]ERN53657.1 hypothetical protein A33I_10650 [Alkalihalophilus marmarensis DSM 21297]
MQAAVIVLILGTIFILAAFLIVSEYLFKRKWGIPMGKVSIFSVERKLIYTAVDIGLFSLSILIFIILLFVVLITESVDLSPVLHILSSVVFTLFSAVLSTFRAFEEWKENKSQRRYYHDIAAAATFISIATLMGLTHIIYL